MREQLYADLNKSSIKILKPIKKKFLKTLILIEMQIQFINEVKPSLDRIEDKNIKCFYQFLKMSNLEIILSSKNFFNFFLAYQVIIKFFDQQLLKLHLEFTSDWYEN